MLVVVSMYILIVFLHYCRHGNDSHFKESALCARGHTLCASSSSQLGRGVAEAREGYRSEDWTGGTYARSVAGRCRLDMLLVVVADVVTV